MTVAGTVLGRVDQTGLDYLPSVAFEHPVEAAFISVSARCPVAALVDSQQDSIAVAIEANFTDDLEVARLFALAPELVA